MRLLLLVFILSIFGCAKAPDDPNSLSKFFPDAPDLTLPDSSGPFANPRYPWAKTYLNSSRGFFSVVGSSSLLIPTGQSFFGFAATETSTLLAIKRIDASNMSWVDLFSILIAASSSASTSMALRCSIRYDGNFSSGFSYDQSSVYFTSTSWPYTLRKFSATTCVEGTAVAIPSTPSPWTSRSTYQMSMGSFLGVYDSYPAQYVRSYDPATGLMTSIVSNKKWSDYTMSFTPGFSRTPSGVWGLNSCGNYQSCLYFASPTDARFGYLPDTDYPDLSRRGDQLTFVVSAPSDSVAYVSVSTPARVRIYRLDTASF